MVYQDRSRPVCCLIVFFVLFAETIFPQENPKRISNPSQLFNIPMAEALRTAEVCVSGGSSFGMEGKGSLIRNLTIGLGGIADAEIRLGGNCVIPVNVYLKKLFNQTKSQTRNE